jgi:hypothetical protein
VVMIGHFGTENEVSEPKPEKNEHGPFRKENGKQSASDILVIHAVIREPPYPER